MKKVNSDVAYDFIREKILNGKYPPGHALMTEVLSSEIGVSRTPIREALHRLKADGLVSIKAHLGASVKKMGLKEFREMCDLRLALEGHATGLAALNHSQTDLRRIKFALESMRSLTDRIIASNSEDELLEELVKEDVHFHIAIMTAAKNDLMKSEILRLHLVNRVVFGPNTTAVKRLPAWSKKDSDQNRRKVMSSHDEIYAAIAKHDAPAAKAAMERHIQDIIDKSLLAISMTAEGGLSRVLTEEELVYSG
jgi:DNA-binding GntR family transcriptional regulator